MKEDVEKLIYKKVTQWTQHMRWRKDYNTWVKGRIFQENNQQPRIDNLYEYIKNIENKIILDLGCGMGGFSVALRRLGFDPVAIDFNFDYCFISKLRGIRHNLALKVCNGMGECLPLRKNSIDIISCFEVLEHTQDPKKILYEIHRVLKPGGVCFISVVNRWAFIDPHYHLPLINLMPRCMGEWIIKVLKHGKDSPLFRDSEKLSEMHYFTWRAFLNLCKNIGFNVFDVRENKLRELRFHITIGKRIMMSILRLMYLDLVAYRLVRNWLMSGFNLILEKRGW